MHIHLYSAVINIVCDVIADLVHVNMKDNIKGVLQV